MTTAELNRRVQELDSSLDDEQLVDLVLALATRPGRDAGRMLKRLASSWPAKDSDLLNAAAVVAARHHGWSGDAPRLRSLLGALAVRQDLAVQLGGTPSNVLASFEQSVMQQAGLQGEAMRTIWGEPMLKSEGAARALGANPRNREKARRLRERSSLLGLPSGNSYLYPEFQFDRRRRQVFAEVAEVNRRLDAAGDPWGVASWWIGRNDRVGTRPIDLVGTERSPQLLDIAQAVVEPVG